MKMNCRRPFLPFLPLCLCVAAMAVFPSCKALRPVRDPASRHLLDPAVPYRTGRTAKPALGVAKPYLPAYLDRQQLVTRDGSGAVKVMDTQLWSEPLDTGITRVLAANLSRITGSTAIQAASSFVSLEYDSVVELRVDQFDPDPSGQMVLECSWKVQPVTGGERNFRSYRTEVPVEVTVPPVAGRIAAMNEALARLAREIARSL